MYFVLMKQRLLSFLSDFWSRGTIALLYSCLYDVSNQTVRDCPKYKRLHTSFAMLENIQPGRRLLRSNIWMHNFVCLLSLDLVCLLGLFWWHFTSHDSLCIKRNSYDSEYIFMILRTCIKIALRRCDLHLASFEA